MSKIFTWIIAIAAVAAVSAPTYAGFNLRNGISSNGISSNGISSNGISSNGISSNGLTSNGLNLQAVRLVMPDGTELSLR
jgi:hypothetical protein